MDLLKKQYQLQGNRSVEVIPRLKSFWVGEALHCYFLPNSKSKPRGWSQKESQFIYIFNYKNKGNYLNNKVKVYIFLLIRKKWQRLQRKKKKKKTAKTRKSRSVSTTNLTVKWFWVFDEVEEKKIHLALTMILPWMAEVF